MTADRLAEIRVAHGDPNHAGHGALFWGHVHEMLAEVHQLRARVEAVAGVMSDEAKLCVDDSDVRYTLDDYAGRLRHALGTP